MHFYSIFPKLVTEYAENGAKIYCGAGFLIADSAVNEFEPIKHKQNSNFNVNNAGLLTIYPETKKCVFTSLAMLIFMPTFGLTLK